MLIAKLIESVGKKKTVKKESENLSHIAYAGGYVQRKQQQRS